MPFSLRSLFASLSETRTARRRAVETGVNVEPMETRALLSATAFGFVAGFDGGAVENAQDVATDSTGAVYSVGSFAGTTDFDPGPGSFPLTAQGPSAETDAFISKLDSEGNFVAAGQFSSADGVEATGIAVDPSGNIYVTGHFDGTTDFDPGPGVASVNGGPGDVFVAKLDSSLNLQWVQRIGGAGRIVANGIAVDDAGRSYIGGWFSGTIDFEAGSGVDTRTAGGSRDGYVLKFDSVGNSRFISQLEGTGSFRTEVTDIDSDRRGNTFITGSFAGTVDFDPRSTTFNLTSAGGKDSFVARLEQGGQLAWARQVGGSSRDLGHAITIDQSTRDVFVASSHVGTVDLNPNPAVTDNRSTVSGNRTTGHEHFLTRFDASGTHVWTNQFAENNGDLAIAGLDTDTDGNVYATGNLSGRIDFDPSVDISNLTASAAQDVFAARYDSAGEFVWAGLADTEFANAVAVADSGAVHVAGYGSGGDFDPGNGVITNGPGAYVWQLTQTFEYEVPANVTDIVIRRNGNQFEIYDAGTATVLESADTGTTAGIVLDGTNPASLDVTVDYGFGGLFDLPNGIDIQSSSGSSDNISVIGDTSLNIEYRPVTNDPGVSRILVDSASDLRFTEFEQVNVSEVNMATIRTRGLDDNLTARGDADLAGDYSMMLRGDAGGTQIVPMRVHDVSQVTVDTRGGNDTVSFNQNSLQTRGLRELTVDTGIGSDTMSVVASDLTLDVPGGGIFFNAGAGTDQLEVQANVDFEMNLNRVLSSGGGTVQFQDLETGKLTGGVDGNRIDARRFDGDVILVGVEGNDTLIGGLGNDTINGGAGNDLIRGRQGNDALRGGADEDSLWGNGGHDLIGGGNDNDIIYGLAGSDTLMGGNGDDQLDGGADNDALSGDAGADMFMIDADDDSNFLDVTLVTTNFVRFQQTVGGVQSQRDTVQQDDDDEVFVRLLGGNDTINVAPNLTLVGTVDGGGGNNSCSTPSDWNSINC